MIVCSEIPEHWRHRSTHAQRHCCRHQRKCCSSVDDHFLFCYLVLTSMLSSTNCCCGGPCSSDCSTCCSLEETRKQRPAEIRPAPATATAAPQPHQTNGLASAEEALSPSFAFELQKRENQMRNYRIGRKFTKLYVRGNEEGEYLRV